MGLEIVTYEVHWKKHGTEIATSLQECYSHCISYLCRLNIPWFPYQWLAISNASTVLLSSSTSPIPRYSANSYLSSPPSSCIDFFVEAPSSSGFSNVLDVQLCAFCCHRRLMKKIPRRMRQARREQPTPIPAFAPIERPVGVVVSGVVVCDVLLLLVVAGILLEVDEVEDGNNKNPGLVMVVAISAFVTFNPKILNFWFDDMLMSGISHTNPSAVSLHGSPFTLPSWCIQLAFPVVPPNSTLNPPSKAGYQICKERIRWRLEIENALIIVILFVDLDLKCEFFSLLLASRGKFTY